MKPADLPEDLPAIKPPDIVWLYGLLNKKKTEPNWDFLTFNKIGVTSFCLGIKAIKRHMQF